MASEPHEPPPASSLADPSTDCGRTPERVAHYLRGGLAGRERAEFRAHLAECASCEATYRESVCVATQLAARRRETRDKRERARAAARRRTMLVEGSLSRHGRLPRTRRNAHLRLILMPAFAVFLMMVIFPRAQAWGPQRVHLTEAEGLVRVSGLLVDEPVESRELSRGDWCAVGPEGRARLELGDTHIELAAGTLLLIEDSAQLRLRIDAGRIDIQGTCVVTAEEGVVEASGGSGHVAMRPEGLEVHTREGAWTAFTSRAEHALAAGETVLLTLE